MTTARDRGSWLALILANAAPEDFEAVRHRGLIAALTEAERRWVEAEALRAEQLRSVVFEHRRRASELSAVNDLALRLAAEHNLAALLQDTVVQARRVLDVDVAYLALPDPDGSLSVHVTDGSLGPRLRGLRLPLHSGLAGRVVDRAEPVQSVDYVDDVDLTHLDGIDQVAVDEGLRSIVGAPLRLRGEVTGVLMVAQRAVRRFSGGELSLLCALGAIAAVALDNARQIDSHRCAAEELLIVNADLEHHVASVNRAATLHDNLLKLALGGGGVDQVVLSLSQVVSGTILFVDEEDRVIMCACAGALTAFTTVVPVNGLVPSRQFLDPEQRRAITADSAVTVPVASANTYFGCVQVQPDGVPTSWDIRLLERAAMTIALVAGAERAVVDAERRSTSDLLEQLLTLRVNDEVAFRRRGLPLGLDLSVPHVVVVMDAGLDRAGLANPLTLLVERHGGVTGRVAGRAVALVRADIRQVREMLDESWVSLPGTVGLGAPATGAAALASAYDEAIACLVSLHALGRTGSYASAADLGPYRFLLSQAGHDDARRFVQGCIGALIAHDASRHTDLVRTADVFLSSGRQHATAAGELHIHANTLYQRLERITATLGDGWRDRDRALEIQMALRMHRLVAGDERHIDQERTVPG